MHKYSPETYQKSSKRYKQSIYRNNNYNKNKTKQNQQMINKHKRWSTLFQIKEKQIQTKRYYFSPLNDLGNDPKGFIITVVGKNVGKEEVLCRR